MLEIRTVALVHFNRLVFLALALGIARDLLPGPLQQRHSQPGSN